MSSNLIAITGKIASGKSKAIELLKATQTYNFTRDIRYIDLDKYCKDNKESFPEVHNFFKNYFSLDIIPSADFIIKEVFQDKKIYEAYCACFVPHLINYLKSFLNDNYYYIVEASAFYSYYEIHHLFSSVIVLNPSDKLRTQNEKARNLSFETVKIFERIFEEGYAHQHTKSSILDDESFPTHRNVNLTLGTLQELRGKVEEAVIRSCYEIDNDNAYLASAISILNYFNSYTNDVDYNSNPYHNRDHTRNVITDLILSGNHYDLLGFTAIYHDYEYLPREKFNEDRSATLAFKHLTKIAEENVTLPFDDVFINMICYYVKNSGYKDVERLNEEPLNNFFLSDISSFTKTPDEIIENSKLLFQEYSFYDWSEYQAGHIKILKEIQTMKCVGADWVRGIDLAIALTRSFKPKIAWFCGSFNPFTIGHLDILKKAEQQFDKVVIVQAHNPSKAIPQDLSNIELLRKYEYLDLVRSIPEALSKVSYKPTLIRGVRNAQDLIDAENWIKCINEFTNDTIECIILLGDKNLNHISSSFVRQAKAMGANANKFLVK